MASLARKNFESPELDWAGFLGYAVSDVVGLKDTAGLIVASLSIPAIPKPDPKGTTSWNRLDSFVEGGAGVPLGVPVGVELALSTRCFLEPDLGVILLLRKVETGVVISSLGVVLHSGRGVLRDNGVVTAGEGEPATRGVNGGRPDALAEALRVGMRGRDVVCLS